VKRSRSILLILLPFVVFTYGSFILFPKTCDYALDVQARKLIPFNHKSHVTTYGATDCELCHGYYDNGRYKGIPTVAECKTCHDGDTAKEKALFMGYKDTDKPWESFSRQPDLVYFSHIAVMKNTKKARCASCHGDKANTMTTAKISGKMKMGVCMDCHTALKISNTCAVCHD